MNSWRFLCQARSQTGEIKPGIETAALADNGEIQHMSLTWTGRALLRCSTIDYQP